MCGIFFSCTQKSDDLKCRDAKLMELLRRRGPDSLSQIDTFMSNFSFRFIGTVLNLRGDQVVPQPLQRNGTENILLWNGEMFNCGDDHEDQSDSLFLFDQLVDCQDDPQSIYSIFSAIHGPFAFIYYHGKCKTLFFGRDSIGRRSLCWRKADEPFELAISSVCHPDESGWEEVPACGIYSLDFSYDVPKLNLVQWQRDIAGTLRDQPNVIPSSIEMPLNDQLPDPVETIDLDDDSVDSFISILSKSIETRVTKFNQLCQRCVDNLSTKCDHSSVGILFSGGLDSSVLALLSDSFIPANQSIDLMNVAFTPDAPDRLTGLEALEEIQSLRPDRKWNFIQIDVSTEDIQRERHHHIRHLTKPSNTVLDDSIACAVWFAARGFGTCRSIEYLSPSRIILLGMGADEQLAGYSRHRNAFRLRGWAGLLDEVRADISRIWTRNLGRDDRIISDHGRESRLPYLDENLINYLNSLPIHRKANLSLERGEGEKILLRKVALKLGLNKVSGYPKRAIQFGSRIAHLEGKGEKGSDQCPRLTDQ